MSRTQELTDLPLWECFNCGRLEFNSVLPDCPECHESMVPQFVPNDNERFEAIGQHFQRDTGHLRPGKDCRNVPLNVRQHLFEEWDAKRLVF